MTFEDFVLDYSLDGQSCAVNGIPLEDISEIFESNPHIFRTVNTVTLKQSMYYAYGSTVSMRFKDGTFAGWINNETSYGTTPESVWRVHHVAHYEERGYVDFGADAPRLNSMALQSLL